MSGNRIERANPLPPGRYWQDIFAHQFEAFDAWLSKNRDEIDILADEHYPAGSNIPFTDLGTPERRWILWEVIEPVTWEGPGLPTVAGESVKTSDDTVQKPHIETPGLGDLGGAAGEAAKSTATILGLTVGAGIVVATVLSRLIK